MSEDSIYERHGRRRGAVLIVGVGAVGSALAKHLARLGISPLCLVDHDVVEPGNIVRHELGEPSIGLPKASTLAEHIRREFPLCEAEGINANFLQLSPDEQRR